MLTISLCMIVKNEEKVLARCLDSLSGLMDEIIIVDTGSTDRTKEIAAAYTDKIYDYQWQDDFSDARNFAFSRASMDYIYSADADEVLDGENRKRFWHLKQAMMPEVEIVQMYYLTKEEFNTTENYEKDYRPKLYKRLRNFVWTDAIHEAVRLSPVVYDSEIEILHLPTSLHSRRDFHIFLRIFQKEGTLSPRLHTMLARELFISGTPEDLKETAPIFEQTLVRSDTSAEEKNEALCVLCKKARLFSEESRFLSLALKGMHALPPSELCYETGLYFMEQYDYEEALFWLEAAAYQSCAAIDTRCGSTLPLLALADCCDALAGQAQKNCPDDTGQYEALLGRANDYRRQADSSPA